MSCHCKSKCFPQKECRFVNSCLERRKKGSTGPTGPTGPTGSSGSNSGPGPTGPTGPASPNTSGGTFVPFSSGTTSTVTSDSIGSFGTVSIMDFGTNVAFTTTGLFIEDPTFAVSGFAFTVPKTGTINAISLSITLVNPPGVNMNIIAQIFNAGSSGNTYIPTLAATSVSILSTNVPGTVAHSIATGLAVPVTAEDRLIFVLRGAASNLSPTTITVFTSGSALFL